MPDVTSPQTAPKPAKPNPITWGPLAAITVTVVVYFLAQFLGSVLLLGFGHAKGLTQTQLDHWLEGVGPQFWYILIVEGATLGLLWLFLKHRKAGFKTLGLVKPHWKDLGYTLIGFGIYFPLLIGSMAAVKAWLPQINMDQQQQVGFAGAHGASLILVFICLVVLPPLTEEILMRGFLFLGLRTKLPLIYAAILTSIVFATAHLQFGSGAPLLWTAAIDTFVLSLVLIFLRVRTGRLWASIGLHMLKNSIAFLALFIFIS